MASHGRLRTGVPASILSRPSTAASSSSPKMFPDPNEPYHTLENHDISSFFPFSPSNLHPHDGLHELLSTAAAAAAAPAPAPLPENKHSSTAQACTNRRRLTRKDRHSKICTAQGPRDRRMRLSLDVARKFFDLQDLLGFDKASKTVQWLLTMSKSSIKELVAASKSDSPSSQCEEEISTVSAVDINEKINTKAKNRPSRPRRSPALPPKVARESREKARARARKRTLDKKLMQEDRSEGDSFNQQTNLKSSSEFVAEMDPEHCSTSSDSIALFDYSQQNAVSNLFQELWDHMSYTSNHIDERYFLS